MSCTQICSFFFFFFFLPRNNNVSWGFFLFCLGIFSPKRMEGQREKKQEEGNLFFFVPGTERQYVYVE